MEMHVTFEEPVSVNIDIQEVEAETDTEVLAEWFNLSLDLIDDIKGDVVFRKEIGDADDQWVWRCGRKIAYLRKANKRIEQRLLRLGAMPPYRLEDGRCQAIRQLEAQNAKLRALLTANGIDHKPEATQ